VEWYDAIALAAVLGQLAFAYYAVRNYRYVRATHRKTAPLADPPHVTLIVPCKGLDTQFEHNISAFFRQDHGNYGLIFVVQAQTDPAYDRLQSICERMAPEATTADVRILVAGLSTACSQKIHNLLYGIERISQETQIIAFADSDICPRHDWLRRLSRPLRRSLNRSKIGLATGYRWFVPAEDNLATLALSAMNAAVAQLLGNSPFNHAWGGSMAVRVEDFRRLGLPDIWKSTLSDDLSLSQAIRKARMKVAFVAGCLAASHESMTWPDLVEFGRRQFLITRVYAPSTWWLGLISSLGAVVGLWGSVALALHARAVGTDHARLYALVPALFIAGHLLRAFLRQSMVARVFPEHTERLKAARRADILGFWLWSPLLLALILSSAFGRTIRWRGTRYRLVSSTRTEVLGP